MARCHDLLSDESASVNGLVLNGCDRTQGRELLNLHLRFDHRSLNGDLLLEELCFNDWIVRRHLLFTLTGFFNHSRLLVGFVPIRGLDDWLPDGESLFAKAGFDDWLGDFVLTLFGAGLQYRPEASDLFRHHFSFVRQTKSLHRLRLHHGFAFQSIGRLETAVVLSGSTAGTGTADRDSKQVCFL